MLPFKKVLVPVDYSEAGDAIVPYVKDTLNHFSGELTLVHAYGPEALGYIDLPVTNPDIADETAANQAEILREYAQKTYPGRHVECFTQLGEAGTVIEHSVELYGADVVMMPTHGRGPLRRMLLGSVAAKILHDISTPVWTGVGQSMDDAETHTPHVPYKSVLCAVDGSEETAAVIVAGHAIAKAYDAKLTVLHVVDVPRSDYEVDYAAFFRDMKEASESQMRELMSSLNIDAPHIIGEGNVADSVRRAAAKVKADLVVAGRGHSQGTFSRMWSHLYTVVREAPCPVLSI